MTKLPGGFKEKVFRYLRTYCQPLDDGTRPTVQDFDSLHLFARANAMSAYKEALKKTGDAIVDKKFDANQELPPPPPPTIDQMLVMPERLQRNFWSRTKRSVVAPLAPQAHSAFMGWPPSMLPFMQQEFYRQWASNSQRLATRAGSNARSLIAFPFQQSPALQLQQAALFLQTQRAYRLPTMSQVPVPPGTSKEIQPTHNATEQAAANQEVDTDEMSTDEDTDEEADTMSLDANANYEADADTMSSDEEADQEADTLAVDANLDQEAGANQEVDAGKKVSAKCRSIILGAEQRRGDVACCTGETNAQANFARERRRAQGVLPEAPSPRTRNHH